MLHNLFDNQIIAFFLPMLLLSKSQTNCTSVWGFLLFDIKNEIRKCTTPVFTMNGVTITCLLPALMDIRFGILNTIFKMIIGLRNIVVLMIMSVIKNGNFMFRPTHWPHKFGKWITRRQTLCTWYYGGQNKRTQCLKRSYLFRLNLELNIFFFLSVN